MPVPIPTSEVDLTAKWLGAALSEGGLDGIEVESIKTEVIGDDAGFIGQIHRLMIDYASAPDSAPSSLIAKMPTTDPGGRLIGVMFRLYEKESGFYRHLAPECPVRSARCYYNGADIDTGNFCLLLEDLAHLTPGDQLVPWTLGETADMLTMLAELHATWSDGRADRHQWLPTIDDPSTLLMLGMFEAAYPVAMERYSHIIPEHMHDWGPRFAPHAPQWVAEFATEPLTIVHGDFRKDNLMFGADGPEVLLDWQVSARSPGAYDVYYLLALSCDKDAVSANFDSLIDHYLAELGGAGATAPDKDTLIDQLRGVGLLLTMAGVVTMTQLDRSNERGQELWVKMSERGISLAETIDLSLKLP